MSKSSLKSDYEAIFHLGLDWRGISSMFRRTARTNVVDVIVDSDPETLIERSRPVSRTRIRAAASQRYEFRIFSLSMKSEYGEVPRRPKNNKDDTMS